MIALTQNVVQPLERMGQNYIEEAWKDGEDIVLKKKSCIIISFM